MVGLEPSVLLINDDLFEIVSFNILQIGELVKNLPIEFIKEHNTIPWKSIAGMRDRIAHGYGTIDPNYIVGIVKSDIPNLLSFCDSLLEDEDTQIKVVEIVDNSKEK